MRFKLVFAVTMVALGVREARADFFFAPSMLAGFVALMAAEEIDEQKAATPEGRAWRDLGYGIEEVKKYSLHTGLALRAGRQNEMGFASDQQRRWREVYRVLDGFAANLVGPYYGASRFAMEFGEPYDGTTGERDDFYYLRLAKFAVDAYRKYDGGLLGSSQSAEQQFGGE